MAVIYLFYTEDDDRGGVLSAASVASILDQFAYMFGGEIACIHPAGADYPAVAPTVVESLEQAQAAHPDHEWVYLDPTATKHVSEYQHPADNVVYVAGHDDTGYGDSETPGTHVRVMEGEGHAIPCLIALCCDRWSRSWQ